MFKFSDSAEKLKNSQKRDISNISLTQNLN